MIKIEFKRLGNHWYPSLPHEDMEVLKLDKKLEDLLTINDEYEYGTIQVYLFDFVIGEHSALVFDKEDYMRYTSSEDVFDLKFVYERETYTISSRLLDAIASIYGIQIKQQYEIDKS